MREVAAGPLRDLPGLRLVGRKGYIVQKALLTALSQIPVSSTLKRRQWLLRYRVSKPTRLPRPSSFVGVARLCSEDFPHHSSDDTGRHSLRPPQTPPACWRA